MTCCGLDEWFWAMFEPLVNFSCELGQIGGSFQKKIQSGA